MLPPKECLTICFAHVAYRMQDRWALRNTGISSFEMRDLGAPDGRIAEADVLLCSGLWRNDLIPRAQRRRFTQSISASVDQCDRAALATAGIRRASPQGVNARAVSEHAMALILGLARRLPEARDNQVMRFWRGMLSDLTQREDELGGKTLLIIGLGQIGNRLAKLAKAFDMRVLATRRDPAAGGDAHEIYGMHMEAIATLLPQADVVALTCPLTPQTERLIDARTLALMRPTTVLVNVAPGRVVDEPALIEALQSGRLAAAALDVTVREPLPNNSPLWSMRNVFITPHTAGETRRYEDNVLDLLEDNLCHLWETEAALSNQVV
jgi:D-2-hydroxyacid dehydrogenase (NADP+)